MARAIRSTAEPSPEPAPDEAPGPLGVELGGSTEAVRAFLELLRGLEEGGYLRFVNDLLRSEDRVVKVLTERVNPEEVRRTVQGLRTLHATIGSLDPGLVARVSERITPGLEEAFRAEGSPPVSFLDVVSALNDPEVNRGIRLLLGFLRGVGRVPPE